MDFSPTGSDEEEERIEPSQRRLPPNRAAAGPNVNPNVTQQQQQQPQRTGAGAAVDYSVQGVDRSGLMGLIGNRQQSSSVQRRQGQLVLSGQSPAPGDGQSSSGSRLQGQGQPQFAFHSPPSGGSSPNSKVIRTIGGRGRGTKGQQTQLQNLSPTAAPARSSSSRDGQSRVPTGHSQEAGPSRGAVVRSSGIGTALDSRKISIPHFKSAQDMSLQHAGNVPIPTPVESQHQGDGNSSELLTQPIQQGEAMDHQEFDEEEYDEEWRNAATQPLSDEVATQPLTVSPNMATQPIPRERASPCRPVAVVAAGRGGVEPVAGGRGGVLPAAGRGGVVAAAAGRGRYARLPHTPELVQHIRAQRGRTWGEFIAQSGYVRCWVGRLGFVMDEVQADAPRIVEFGLNARLEWVGFYLDHGRRSHRRYFGHRAGGIRNQLHDLQLADNIQGLRRMIRDMAPEVLELRRLLDDIVAYYGGHVNFGFLIINRGRVANEMSNRLELYGCISRNLSGVDRLYNHRLRDYARTLAEYIDFLVFMSQSVCILLAALGHDPF